MVGKLYKLPFQSGGGLTFCVAQNSVAHFPGKVQPFAVALKLVNHTQALLIVTKAAGAHAVKGAFAGVAKGRVPKVVAKGNRLCKIFIKAQGNGHGAGNLRHLKRVGKAGAVMVALRA